VRVQSGARMTNSESCGKAFFERAVISSEPKALPTCATGQSLAFTRHLKDDVLTAKHGDFAVSVLTAVLGELPLAMALIIGPLRIARLQVCLFSRPWCPFSRRARPDPWGPTGRKP
jgi:hypothetical protein